MYNFLNKFIIKGDYKNIIKKVGILLTIAGFIDIAYMIMVVSGGRSYSSSFNIFAVVAGLLMIRGGLKTTRIVLFFCGFYLAVFFGLMLTAPFVTPIDFFITSLKLDVSLFVSSILFPVMIVIAISWVYLNLSSKAVLDGLKSKGYNLEKFWKRSYSGLVIGLIFAIGMSFLIFNLMGGEDSDLAIQKAKAQTEGEYKYFVNAINVNIHNGKKSVSAQVTAYNSNEIKTLNLKW